MEQQNYKNPPLIQVDVLTVEREIAIGKIIVRIKSIFTGKETLTDKLFIIADRKLKS